MHTNQLYFPVIMAGVLLASFSAMTPSSLQAQDRLTDQGQRTLSSLRGKDLHQELVAPAGDLAFPFDTVF